MPSVGEARKRQEKARRERDLKERNEIGDIPEIKDPERRRSCESDPEKWLRTYHP